MNIEVSSVIAIGLFGLAHTAGLIWWMSKTTTTLEYMDKTIKSLGDVIKTLEANSYTAVDAAKDFAMRDLQIQAIFKKLDHE